MRWSRWTRRTSPCAGSCREGPQKLGDGLLRHGGCPERGPDAAGGRGAGADVHCPGGGQFAYRHGLRGVRPDDGPDGLRRGEPAEPALRAGQGGGADLRVPAGVLSAGKALFRENTPRSAAGRLQAAALQRCRAGHVRAGAAAGACGQHFAGAEDHRAGGLAGHPCHGQRCLSAV